jgi:hypothetical protein
LFVFKKEILLSIAQMGSQLYSDVTKKFVLEQEVKFLDTEEEDIYEWFRLHGYFIEARTRRKHEIKKVFFKKIEEEEAKKKNNNNETDTIEAYDLFANKHDSYQLDTKSSEEIFDENRKPDDSRVSKEEKTKIIDNALNEIVSIAKTSKLNFLMGLLSAIETKNIYIYTYNRKALMDKELAENKVYLEGTPGWKEVKINDSLRLIDNKLVFKIENVIASLIPLKSSNIQIASESIATLMYKHLNNRKQYITFQIKVLKINLKLTQEKLTPDEITLHAKLKFSQTIENIPTGFKRQQLFMKDASEYFDEKLNGNTAQSIKEYLRIHIRQLKNYLTSSTFLHRRVVTVNYCEDVRPDSRSQVHSVLSYDCRGSLMELCKSNTKYSDMYLY